MRFVRTYERRTSAPPTRAGEEEEPEKHAMLRLSSNVDPLVEGSSKVISRL